MTDEPRRWLSFDPTIHAGHVMTAVTILICATASWYGVQSDIKQLKDADTVQVKRLDKVEQDEKDNRQEVDRKINDLIKDNNQALAKLRDDMNGWFMALNDKLDRKADKR